MKVNRAELDPVRHADRDAVDLGAFTRGAIVLERGIRLPVFLHLVSCLSMPVCVSLVPVPET